MADPVSAPLELLSSAPEVGAPVPEPDELAVSATVGPLSHDSVGDLPRISLAELAFFSGQALGKGGFGEVWAGVWISDKVRQVAVKRVRESFGSLTLRDSLVEEVGRQR